LLFATRSEQTPVQLGLGDVGVVAFVLAALIVACPRATNPRLVIAFTGRGFAAFGMAAGRIALPLEIARYAVPEAVLLRRSLRLGVFASVDGLPASSGPS
jgi:hypothetical protein